MDDEFQPNHFWQGEQQTNRSRKKESSGLNGRMLTQLKNCDAANKFTNVLLLLSGDAKDKWINAGNDIMPNNKNPTEDHFHAVWTAFIINYGASNKTTKGL
jgi:hypothetical protein